MNIDFGRSFVAGERMGRVVLTPETPHERQLMLALLRLVKRGLRESNVPSARVEIDDGDLAIGVSFEYDLPQSHLRREDRLPAPPVKCSAERAKELVAGVLAMAEEGIREQVIIERAEAYLRAPAGHVIDDMGVARQVAGDLAVTCDGFVLGREFSVYEPDGSGGVVRRMARLTGGSDRVVYPSMVFVSEAAAKQAAERWAGR